MTRHAFHRDEFRRRRRPSPASTGQAELELLGPSTPTGPAEPPIEFYAPLGRPERPTVTTEQRAIPLEGTIDADYVAWLATEDGAAIFGRIRSRAVQMWHSGAQRIGVKALCERERWDSKVHIDNRFTSRIARDLIEKHAFLGKVIQLRQLDSSEGVSE